MQPQVVENISKKSTFGYDESSKDHNNQQSKRSKGISNYHISAQRCHDPEKSQRCLVQKEKQQKLSQKSAHDKVRSIFKLKRSLKL
jgi:hypothetical protein